MPSSSAGSDHSASLTSCFRYSPSWARGTGCRVSPPSGRSCSEKALRSILSSSARLASVVWKRPPCSTITASLTIVNRGSC